MSWDWLASWDADHWEEKRGAIPRVGLPYVSMGYSANLHSASSLHPTPSHYLVCAVATECTCPLGDVVAEDWHVVLLTWSLIAKTVPCVGRYLSLWTHAETFFVCITGHSISCLAENRSRRQHQTLVCCIHEGSLFMDTHPSQAFFVVTMTLVSAQIQHAAVTHAAVAHYV